MAAPRSAKLSGTVQWDDGENFNGFIICLLVPPTKSGSDWTAIYTGTDTDSPRKVPTRFIIPIVDGEYNQSLGLFFNADLTPHNSQYAAYFYDSTGTQIAGPTAVFSVTADPTTPTVPTLTAPVLGSTIPSP